MKSSKPSGPTELAPGLWTLDFPFRLLGISIGRRVTILRLTSGNLIVHSTAPFTEESVSAIRDLGRPAALVDGTLFHDTFAKQGRAAFPEVPYFAPASNAAWNQGARPIDELPALTGGEIAAHPIEGIPSARECVLIHSASQTVVVCDLIFNIQPPQPRWTAFAFKYVNGCYGRPGITRLFRSMIRDKAGFRASVEALLEIHSFDRLVPAHGRVLESDVKEVLRREIERL